MQEVSSLRLYGLRAVYLMIGVCMGALVWPGVLHHDKPWELMHGVVNCMLAALSLLALLGVRYPLQMLPLLMWELAWKTIWLLVVALPLWRANALDAGTAELAVQCLVVIVVPIALPWRYVFDRYVRQRGDRWR
jgi:hypothetical protein